MKTVEVNRDILGTLLALTAKIEKVINFENALENPLCSVPLSLACPDGTPRKTAKSKLLDVLRKRCRLPLTHPRENQPQKGSVAAFIIDLMPNIRMITGIPEGGLDVGIYQDNTNRLHQNRHCCRHLSRKFY